ncbi:hypothetical protein LJR220_001533 [Bradyrhizobium sp. LjRoot220]|uniref:hypothetical protein n=1 Tax=Bradyrhizobium sp. LjRoot220 TaxID=3342284 RepID=UPI003ECF3C13
MPKAAAWILSKTLSTQPSLIANFRPADKVTSSSSNTGRPARLNERFGVAVIRERVFEQDFAMPLAIRRSNFRAARLNRRRSGSAEVRRVALAKSGPPVATQRWLVCPAAVL